MRGWFLRGKRGQEVINGGLSGCREWEGVHGLGGMGRLGESGEKGTAGNHGCFSKKHVLQNMFYAF